MDNGATDGTEENVEQGDDESGGESCHRVEQKSDSKFFLVESGPDLSDYEPTTTKLHSGRRRRPGRVKPNRCVAEPEYPVPMNTSRCESKVRFIAESGGRYPEAAGAGIGRGVLVERRGIPPQLQPGAAEQVRLSPVAAVVRRINAHENRLGIDCMKWGLVPHWTEAPVSLSSHINIMSLSALLNIRSSPSFQPTHGKQHPAQRLISQKDWAVQSVVEPRPGSLLNTINARDDKVVEPRGLWNTVKGKRRCIILCEGSVSFVLVLTSTRRTSSSHRALRSFFEWLNKGKDKIPHFTKRTGADEPLMCLAGLWDSVTYKGTSEELHTFTIITTSSNKYLSFLHDRMPVILADRESIETWLDTSSGQWSDSLAQLLKPFAQDDGLVSYPVPKEVGKVGNQSSDFLKVCYAPTQGHPAPNDDAQFFFVLFFGPGKLVVHSLSRRGKETSCRFSISRNHGSRQGRIRKGKQDRGAGTGHKMTKWQSRPSLPANSSRPKEPPSTSSLRIALPLLRKNPGKISP
ncbi:uncharacterized protein VP01_591g3 [Puccinia sorghi]|uniref:DUF159 domain protein n=1 Tax=Puccinia sorghi TaxID=27349 RepID=A0A0L6UHU0_9BASI|nr:uncharacterized protein VP01_591g3 [Puccinia sorghi]